MSTKKAKTKEIPLSEKNLGALVDELYDTREKRLALQKEVDALAERESSLKNYLIETLPGHEANGVAGKLARVTLRTKEVPTAKNWDLVHEYVRKNASKGAFALLQKRLNESAVKEIWEAGKQIPGVEAFTKIDLSINKL